MAKTLVIKGADFSENYVARVTFASIPCTGLEFDQDEYVITGYNEVTVVYTVTPSNTTDDLIWSSSDENVVQVSGGTMTIIGIGEAVITAVCGNMTASANVSVEIACNPVWHGSYVNNSERDGVPFITQSDGVNRVTAFGINAQATVYKTVETTDTTTPHPLIKIPKNTKSIKVSIPTEKASLFKNSSTTDLLWAKDEWCGISLFSDGIAYVGRESGYNITTNNTKVFTVPEDADAFVLMVNPVTQPTTAGEDVTDYMATTELLIEFLTETIGG